MRPFIIFFFLFNSARSLPMLLWKGNVFLIFLRHLHTTQIVASGLKAKWSHLQVYQALYLSKLYLNINMSSVCTYQKYIYQLFVVWLFCFYFWWGTFTSLQVNHRHFFIKEILLEFKIVAFNFSYLYLEVFTMVTFI